MPGAMTEFDAAVRKGRRPDGYRLYPAMPFNAYTKMTGEEVLAIRAYLDYRSAGKEFGSGQHAAVPIQHPNCHGVWDALYFTEGEYQPIPRNPPNGTAALSWSRVLPTVGACHTSKSFLGGDKREPLPAGLAFARMVRPEHHRRQQHRSGWLGGDDIVLYLKSGHNRIEAATGPMAEVVDCRAPK